MPLNLLGAFLTRAGAGTSNFPLNKSGPRARRSRAATAEAHLAPPRRNHECCVYLVCGHNIIAPSFSPSFVGAASTAWWRHGIATSNVEPAAQPNGIWTCSVTPLGAWSCIT